ncbi:MAG: DUF4214 domain-containing protein [Huintestinicola sp.]
MKFKKFLSSVLALAAALNMLSVQAFAETRTGYVSEIGEYREQQFADLTYLTNLADLTDYSAVAQGSVKPTGGLTHYEPIEDTSEELAKLAELNQKLIEESTVTTKSAYTFNNSYYYNQLTTVEKQFYNKFSNLLKNFQNSSADLTPEYVSYWDKNAASIGTVSYQGLSIAQATQLIEIVYYENPQYYFFNNKWLYNPYQETIMPYTLYYNGSQRAAIRKSIDEQTNTWMAEIAKCPTALEKETYIAEKICNTVTYTYTPHDQTLVGSLYNHKAVCNGYAMLFNYFCNAAGIPCITVRNSSKDFYNEATGENLLHAWNNVYINGNWYLTDTTWMDEKITNVYDFFYLNNNQESVWQRDIEDGYIMRETGMLCHTPDPYFDIDYKDYVVLPDLIYSNPRDYTFDESKAAAYVERLYTQLLGRASDAKGKQNHLNNLKAGYSAADVARGFVLSTELQNKKLTNKEFVRRMYVTMLNRNPDASGLNRWATALDNGCSYGYVFAGFTSSAEFTNLCKSYGILRGLYVSPEYRDKNEKLTAYVSRMYTKALNRTYDVKGLNNHTGRYITGTKDAKGIAHDFIFSTEFKNRNLTNDQFINVMYATFFNRAADAKGKANWTARMNSGWTREQVFNGFTSSTEFKNLVASFGI